MKRPCGRWSFISDLRRILYFVLNKAICWTDQTVMVVMESSFEYLSVMVTNQTETRLWLMVWFSD